MRRALAVLPLALVAVASGSAQADSGAMFGESARTGALAGAVTARASELTAIGQNPGALAALDEAMVAATVHAGTLDLWFEREGEPSEDLGRGIAGTGASIGTPLPGPLRPLRFGVAFHVPLQYALKLVAPSRSDVPTFPLYGDRAERSAATAALALNLFDRLGIGAGITLSPTLAAPTVVSYDAQRSENVDRNVVVDIERELDTDTALLLGVRSVVTSKLALGVAYRQAVQTRAVGPNDVVAGTLVVDDRIDFNDFLAPDELAVGACVGPFFHTTLSVDVVRAQWSAYRTIHNEVPQPGLNDVFDVRAGVEIEAVPALPIRFGYGYEPTPVPEQVGVSNLLDGDRHILSLGAGLDLRALAEIPLRVDAYGVFHAITTTTSVKDPAALGDRLPSEPGQQIDNLGYPSTRSGGFVLHGGMTLSYFFGQPAGVEE